MPDTPYRPIACADYDVYEIAIMRGHLLLLKCQVVSGDTLCGASARVVTPLALEIKEGAEYLRYASVSMEISEIRLDRILHAEIMAKPAKCTQPVKD